jgi:ligand-binding SRPBCC domain-containing protein|uniref:Coenzyme Q-binding protein COQ10 START domain-containing protein n=1 Tax=uncultured haloarchaeon TaxID=160804 RepID=A5YS68_9EURY|nr:hypothetical protein [uncultured haloarchaeon]
MTVYHRRTTVEAPFSQVWEFHSQISGLEALTPSWMFLSIDSVHYPEPSAAQSKTLVRDSEIEMSMRPLGVLPRQHWVSRIIARERNDTTGYFIDKMIGGPFQQWEHTHRFFADGEQTILDDQVEYQLPGGRLGRRMSVLGLIGFEAMFRGRHRTTKALLEDEA